MKKSCKFLVIASILMIHLGFTQDFSPVQINHITSGSQDTDGGNSIAIHGSYVHLLWQDMDSTFCSFVSTSSDGGQSFGQPVMIAPAVPNIFGAIVADNNGNISLVWDGIAEEMISGVYYSRSTDHAQSFSEPVEVTATGFFPEILAVDDFVFVSYYEMETDSTFGYYFSRSIDGGASFETPYEITSAEIDHFKMDSPNSMTLDSNGDIYCAWNDGRGNEVGTDIFLAKSSDNGLSFGENILVNLHNTADDELRTAPGIDIGSGNIYAVWREEANHHGEGRRILFAKASLDDLSFGPEMMIISGGWSTPCLTTSMRGDVYVAYPQQGDHTNGLFCLKSSDEGATFPVTVLISQVGEYVKYPSIQVDDNNMVNAVWTLAREDDEDDVFYTKGSINIVGLAPGEQAVPRVAELAQNFPNPFNPTTMISYFLPEAMDVSLVIYDVSGRVVSRPVRRHQTSGYHEVQWNGTNDLGTCVNAGVYFAVLEAGLSSQTIKMVYLN